MRIADGETGKIEQTYIEPPAHQNGFIWIQFGEDKSQIFHNHVCVIVSLHKEVIIVKMIFVGVEQTLTCLLPQYTPTLVGHCACKVV